MGVKELGAEDSKAFIPPCQILKGMERRDTELSARGRERI
jgi:hypothetical protein